jgi:hypothetical protein
VQFSVITVQFSVITVKKSVTNCSDWWKNIVMIKSTNHFKAISFKEVTATDCFKTKQTRRRATQSKNCLRVENMAFIFIFKWKSIYLKQD